MTRLLPILFAGAFLAAGIPTHLRAADQEGISIDDSLTIAKCGGCHARDGAGIMRRLSYMRTTPEVWEQNIKRMVRLNSVSLTSQEAFKIVQYLSKNNGLAPEEAKPIFWEAEHRRFRDQEDDALVPEPLQGTCNYCHTIGRVLGQRRTRDDYEKLANMHMGLFRYTEIAVFRPYTPAVALPVVTSALGGYATVLTYPDPPAKPAKPPIEKALDYLAANQPLITPEWTAWKTAMRSPQIAGTWLVNGYEKGKGRVYGQMSIEATADPDVFVTKTELHYASTGLAQNRTGKGVVYTGYSWRGRSKSSEEPKDPSLVPQENKEAMFIARDGLTMQGRWFWGGYDEFGIDVQLTRARGDLVVFGTDRMAVQSPSSGEMLIYGGGFAPSLKPSDIDLGPGIQVTKISKVTPLGATIEYTAAAGLVASTRDVTINGVSAVKAFAVYDKIAYVKVMPDANFARLGGTIASKQYAQFEAIAFSAGPDGIPETSDDVALGPVPAAWSLEEFFSTPDDDDVKYVGSINDSGLFTPSLEGPNPSRKKQYNNLPTDNYGDVWVNAEVRPANGPPMKARSYLVVGVPLYIHYDQPEVSQ